MKLLYIALCMLYVLHSNEIISMQNPLDTTVESIEKESTIYLSSDENSLVPVPRHMLSQEFFIRIKKLYREGRLGCRKQNNKIIISCNNYKKKTLVTACQLLSHECSIKLAKKPLNEIYTKSVLLNYCETDKENLLTDVKNLLIVLRFLGISNSSFSYVLTFYSQHFKCNPQQLFYSIEQLYEEIQEENLKSLPISNACIIEGTTEESDSRKQLNAQLNLSPLERRKIAFAMALKYESQDPTVTIPYIIDKQSWRDLELLCGPKSVPDNYFASSIDCTCTELGKVLLYSKLLQPTTDKAVIEKRQGIIKILVNNPGLFQELDTLFRNFFKKDNLAAENNLLSLWAESDFFTERFINSDQIQIPHFNKFSEFLNTNELAVECLGESELLILVFSDRVTSTIKKAYISLKGLEDTGATSSKDTPKETISFILKHIQPLIAGQLGSYLKLNTTYSITPSENVNQVVSSAINGYLTSMVVNNVSYLISSFNYPEAVKAIIEARLCIQKKLVLIRKYVEFLKKVNTVVKRFPANNILNLNALDLGGQQAQPATIRDILAQFWHQVTHPATFEQFINNLNTSTFASEATSLNFFTGRVMATYRLVGMHKEKLFNATMAMAELDAYLSLARLYINGQNKPVNYCFPEYETSTQPHIDLHEFWNPRVGLEAIPNSLAFGGSTDAKDAVITGPIARGKSTLMKALIFAILMGQTYGIVPANKLNGAKFTPFSNLRAYLNITDNLAQGYSSGLASLLRARDVLSAAASSSATALSLTVLDEPYNGNEALESESETFGTLMYLSNLPHNVSLVSTHHTECAEAIQKIIGNKFAYYKFSPRDSAIVSPYQLQKGIHEATDLIRFKTAKENGLPEAVLYESENYANQKVITEAKLLELFLTCLTDAGNLDFIALINLIKKENNPKLYNCLKNLLLNKSLRESIGKMLQHSAQKNAEEIKMFLNSQDEEGRTILHHAAIRNFDNKEYLYFLISLEADPSVKDKLGKTPCMYATKGSIAEEVLLGIDIKKQ